MKIIEQKIEFEGRRISVRQDRIVDESGRETSREAVVHPGAVCIVALPSPDTVVLVRQYRHATGEVLIELPAGTLEKGEAPVDTARRELEEETGYRAAQLYTRGTFYTSPGISNELMYLYEARDLVAGEQRLDEGEEIEVSIVRRTEALQMIRDGRIRDAKSLVGLMTVFASPC